MRLYSAPPLLATGTAAAGASYWDDVILQYNWLTSAEDQKDVNGDSRYDATLHGSASRDATDGLQFASTAGDAFNTGSNLFGLELDDGGGTGTGTGNFAFECWVKNQDSSFESSLAIVWASGNTSFNMTFTRTGFNRIRYDSGGNPATATYSIAGGGDSFPVGTLRYVGYFRHSGTEYCYIGNPSGAVSLAGSASFTDEFLKVSANLRGGYGYQHQHALRISLSNRGVTGQATITPDSLPLSTS